jgi:hypothetical protein
MRAQVGGWGCAAATGALVVLGRGVRISSPGARMKVTG